MAMNKSWSKVTATLNSLATKLNFDDQKKTSSVLQLDADFVSSNLQRIARRKKFKPHEYEALLTPYLGTCENLVYSELISRNACPTDVLVIRHDIDHDDDTALQIARWEKDRGIKATYCILHTAWYYGRLTERGYKHTDRLISLATGLHELGHEINFHNNLVTLGLTIGIDPRRLLEAELSFFRETLEIPIYGTSTHGDALCRELSYRNWELFEECCDQKFGGPRVLSHTSDTGKHSVVLGEASMADFDLTYEAYDLHRHIYHTDSGGNLRTRENSKGRDRLSAINHDSGNVVGVLTHPIWWDFS